MNEPSDTVLTAKRWSLADHVGGTYFALRMGLAMLALTLPLVLFLVGKLLYELPLQSSLSAYYYAAVEGQCATFPMRTLFIGYLLAIGAGLFFYKGLTPLENRLLNVAAICIALLAIFPERITAEEALTDTRIAQLFETCPAVMRWAEMQSGWVIHYAAGIGLFVMLSIVTWVCACKTLEYLPAEKANKSVFRLIYRTLSVLMLALPLAAYWLVQFFEGPSTLYFVELAAIWTFAIYWLVKSRELALSGLEFGPRQASRAEVEPGEVAASKAAD